MPKIEIDAIEPRVGSSYPAPYDQPVANRIVRNLSVAGGVRDFIANHVTLHPGDWSSQRHWHEDEDEMVIILSGYATLVDDMGRTPLAPGDCVAFPKGDGNGHHLVADRGEACMFVAIGLPETGLCHYPDADLLYDAKTDRDLHRDGTPY